MEKHIELKKFLFIVCAIILNICEPIVCQNNILNKNAKIIIIGSGPSGIAAATKLMENGFNNVTILEAEDRIGGRVYTTKFGKFAFYFFKNLSISIRIETIVFQFFMAIKLNSSIGNYSIDLGGQWVHGTKGNIAYELANPYGLVDVSDKKDSGLDVVALDSSGNHVDPEFTNKMIDFYYEYVDSPDFRKDSASESLGQRAEKA